MNSTHIEKNTTQTLLACLLSLLLLFGMVTNGLATTVYAEGSHTSEENYTHTTVEKDEASEEEEYNKENTEEQKQESEEHEEEQDEEQNEYEEHEEGVDEEEQKDEDENVEEDQKDNEKEKDHKEHKEDDTTDDGEEEGGNEGEDDENTDDPNENEDEDDGNKDDKEDKEKDTHKDDYKDEEDDDDDTSGGSGGGSHPKDSFTLSAVKIVCAEEADLPNWGAKIGNPNITETTATDFVAEHNHCEFVENWEFQWAPEGTPNPGDNNTSLAGGEWSTFGPTDADGVAEIEISSLDLSETNYVWVREVLKDEYIPFTGITTTKDISAEMYCHVDTLNYDNYDRVDGPKGGETYHCIAFNVLKETEATTTPTVSLTAEPDEVEENATSTLTWISENADTCSGTNFDTGGLLNGTTTVTLQDTTTFSIACDNSEGDTATSSVTVVVKDDDTGGNGGGEEQTGSITVCKLIGGIDTGTTTAISVATSSAGLPQGSFALDIATSADLTQSILQTVTLKAQNFSPNTTVFGDSGSNAHCTTVDGLSLATSTATASTTGYFYSEERVTGSAWLAPRYNDQFDTEATSTDSFFLYSPELFGDFEGEIASSTRNQDADGHIVLTKDRPDRTLLLLNTYEFVQATTTATTTVSLTAEPDEVEENATSTLTWISENADTCSGTNFDTEGLLNGSTTVTVQETTEYTIFCENAEGGAATSSVTVTVKDSDDDDDNKGGGGNSGGGGGSGGGGSSGGGGGGGPIPLDIFNESIEKVQESNSVIIEWNTNRSASSQVVYGTTSLNENQLDRATTTFGYELHTIELTENTLTHAMTVSGLDPKETYHFRPISRAAGNEEAYGTELSYSPTSGVTGTGGPARSCTLLEDYLHIDWDNDPAEVTKLQVFLNEYENIDVPINGVFGQTTFDGVVTFQERYFDDVLAPWTHDAGTGFVYITTSTKINEIVCEREFPFTEDELAEMTEFRAFLEALQAGGGTSPGGSGAGEEEPRGTEGFSPEDTVGIATTSNDGVATETQDSRAGQAGLAGIGGGAQGDLFAGSFFSFPTDFSEVVWSLTVFVVILLVLYMATVLLIPHNTQSTQARRDIFFERSVLFTVLTFAVLLGAIVIPATFLVIPLAITLVGTIIALLIRTWKKKDKPSQESDLFTSGF